MNIFYKKQLQIFRTLTVVVTIVVLALVARDAAGQTNLGGIDRSYPTFSNADPLGFTALSNTTLTAIAGTNLATRALSQFPGMTNYVDTATNALTQEINTKVGKSTTITVNGVTGQLDSNLVFTVAGGGDGTYDHAALSNLTWSASVHTGTPARVAGFLEGGYPGYVGFGAGLYLDDNDDIVVSNSVLEGAALGSTSVQPAQIVVVQANVASLSNGLVTVEGRTNVWNDVVNKVSTNNAAYLATVASASTALQAETDSIALGQLTTHTNRTDNPHIVTASQVGATPIAHTNDPIAHTELFATKVATNHTGDVTVNGSITATNAVRAFDFILTNPLFTIPSFNTNYYTKAEVDGAVAVKLDVSATNDWTVSAHSAWLTAESDPVWVSEKAGYVTTSSTNGWTVSAHDVWITSEALEPYYPRNNPSNYITLAEIPPAVAEVDPIWGAVSNSVIAGAILGATALQPAQTNGWVVSSHSSFLTAEADPTWTSEKAGYVAKADTNGWTVSSHSSFLTAEIDPIWASEKTGYVAKTDTNGWTVSAHQAWLTSETDPTWSSEKSSYVAKADTNGWVVSSHGSFLTAESDPVWLSEKPNYVAKVDTNGWVVSSHSSFLTSESDSIALGQLTTHTNRTDNPHTVTAAQIGAVATTDTNGWTVSAHEAWLTAETDATALGALTTHTNRTDNPHVVTAAQLGAVTTDMTNGWVVAPHTGFVTETITNGLASTSYVDTKFNATLVKKAVLDGDLTAMFASTPVKKITFVERGAGITITRIVVQSSDADPVTELNANIYYCDEQGTGGFPAANPTLVEVIDTITGDYDSGVIADSIPTTKELYLLIDADPTDLNKTWTITISYTIN
jgi:hypothetical protein